MEHWSDGKASSPFSELEFGSRSGGQNGRRKDRHEVQTPKIETDPSDLEQYIDKAATLHVPSLQKTRETKDVPRDLQAILSAPIKCTLPLIELLKLRPELWEGLTGKLVDHGTLNRGRLSQVGPARTAYYEPVELKKVSGIQTRDEGNTTLPIVYEGIESIAILDSGAGISIATKSIWEKWGRPTVRRRTRMNLQLADGSLENPIGLLENVTVTSCGIKYEHTFAIVDFGRNTNYEVILGRPFIRQF